MVNINKKKLLPGGIKQIIKHSYIQAVINPKGKKSNVEIFQGSRPGFTATSVGKKGRRRFIASSNSAEGLARRLARKGHKKIIFKD